jgi:hypothetical protein
MPRKNGNKAMTKKVSKEMPMKPKEMMMKPMKKRPC